MDESLTMEIKDNAFARQFETTLEDELISVEYFSREKIFLTKINTPESFSDEASLINSYEIMAIAEERKFKVVPILPRIVAFFKRILSIKNYSRIRL
jgi:hypothetical protein